MNPLVAAGLIPEHLQDILVSPEDGPKKKKRSRMVTKARVITGDEYMEIMREKGRKKENEQREKEDRKKKREEKRLQKEKEKEEKKKEK